VAEGEGRAERGLRPWDRNALDAIRFSWGDAYEIGHDDEHGFWAARRDRIGGLILAGGPEELRRAVADDYAGRPVPRGAGEEATIP